MPVRINYYPGEQVGPNNIIFLKETKPYIRPSGRKERKGTFICPLCGNHFDSLITNIRTGKTKSCGCKKKIDLTNKRFGKLVALKPTEKREINGSVIWECICDCGNKCEVASKYLTQGNRTSCCSCFNGKDLTNQKFGKLKVIKNLGYIPDRHSTFYECLCECGKITTVSGGDLKSGHTKSCGCLIYKQKDITNQKFGKLTALYFNGYTNSGHIKWHCICECGKEIDVVKSSLVSGHTKSCGCTNFSNGELKIEQLLKNNNIKYITQKIFNDCKNPKTNKSLRFDFYLPDYNYCIEYDGEQHFFSNGGWNTLEHLKQTQYRDNIKNQYCKEHNIGLIRIPYYNIDKITIKDLIKE